jgi:hypothetical protein
VPCCFHAEFWVRFADFIINPQEEAAYLAIYVRANKEFISRLPELFLEQGCLRRALDI